MEGKEDDTEGEARQARLLQTAYMAAIGRLAGGVAHEINTPLATIALRTERLRKTAQDPELLALPAFRDFPRYLEAIDADLHRCKTIIASLVDFSRSRPPETRETDLNALVETAVALVGYQMRMKQVVLSLRARGDLPSIRADDGRLRQAILGLLMNAFDAVEPGGHVAVETGREGDDRVSFTVVDDGAARPAASETGLGEIRVRREEAGGTRVSLVLPISGERRARP